MMERIWATVAMSLCFTTLACPSWAAGATNSNQKSPKSGNLRDDSDQQKVLEQFLDDGPFDNSLSASELDDEFLREQQKQSRGSSVTRDQKNIKNPSDKNSAGEVQRAQITRSRTPEPVNFKSEPSHLKSQPSKKQQPTNAATTTAKSAHGKVAAATTEPKLRGSIKKHDGSTKKLAAEQPKQRLKSIRNRQSEKITLKQSSLYRGNSRASANKATAVTNPRLEGALVKTKTVPPTVKPAQLTTAVDRDESYRSSPQRRDINVEPIRKIPSPTRVTQAGMAAVAGASPSAVEALAPIMSSSTEVGTGNPSTTELASDKPSGSNATNDTSSATPMLAPAKVPFSNITIVLIVIGLVTTVIGGVLLVRLNSSRAKPSH